MRFLLLLLVGGLACAQDSSPRKLISSLDGKDLFPAYCASCHGTDGKGKGAVATALKKGVPDITTISRRNKGQFPAPELEKMILGQSRAAAAHGTREMPVWGPLFRPVENDQDLGMVRAHNLVEYIRTLQVK